MKVFKWKVLFFPIFSFPVLDIITPWSMKDVNGIKIFGNTT